MHLPPIFWLRHPLTALLYAVLRLQRLLPRPLRTFGRRRSRRRYSVVTAVYNAAPWLSAYFTSLLCQTLDTEHRLEIICVDDGSTDASAAVIKGWQQRYPGVITYIRKENGGAASARNLGLEAATGEWVTFIDADDFVHPGYFAAVDAFLDAPANAPLGMVVCNYVMFAQKTGACRNTHPMRHRFDDGERRIPANDTGDFTHVVTNSAFFLRRVLMETGIRQKEDVRPTFEDGEMVIRYVLAIADPAYGMEIGILPRARYCHRQHPEVASLTQKAYQSPDYFEAPLALGCLRLLREIREQRGVVPLFAQMTAAYSLSQYFRRILDENAAFARLPEAAKKRFLDLVRDILEYIEPDTLEKAYFPAAPVSVVALLLGLYKGREFSPRRVYIERYDAASRALRVFFHSRAAREEPRFAYDGQVLAPGHSKATILPAWGQGDFYEHAFWLPLPHAEGILEAGEGAEFFPLSGRGSLGGRIPLRDILARLKAAERPFLAWDQALRIWAATLPPLRALYGRAWMFMDRDIQADDNAEHLYRHILREHPEQPAFFVLRRRSPDWARLRAEGFRLVPFGSLRHKILLLNCERLVVSQYDKAATAHLPPVLCRHTLAVLGHGVTRGDNAKSMNKLPVAFRPMVSRREQDYVTADLSPFRLTRKEAVLTGMPRFDALFRARGHTAERRILFMPSWRKYLTGIPDEDTVTRHAEAGFEDSFYARTIRGFLHSQRLAALLERHKYRVDFFPHFHMAQYFRGQAFPGRVRLAVQQPGQGIQDFFQQARVVVTDYSSIAFDAAFLGRALIYYQFDRNAPDEGDHYAGGYFDYERDGFGPVTETLDETLDVLERIMVNGGTRDEEYARRAEAAFAFHDDGSCERVFKAIKGL